MLQFAELQPNLNMYVLFNYLKYSVLNTHIVDKLNINSLSEKKEFKFWWNSVYSIFFHGSCFGVISKNSAWYQVAKLLFDVFFWSFMVFHLDLWSILS